MRQIMQTGTARLAAILKPQAGQRRPFGYVGSHRAIEPAHTAPAAGEQQTAVVTIR